MSSMDARTVTIDRSHFDALMRRAQFDPPVYDADQGLVQALPIVSISQQEYHELHKVARQYANLRQNLLRGGVGEDTIALLSSDEATRSQNEAYTNTSTGSTADVNAAAPDAFPCYGGVGAANGQTTAQGLQTGAYRQAPGLKAYGHRHTSFTFQRDWHGVEHVADDASVSMETPLETVETDTQGGVRPSRPQYERTAQRTVQLNNLPDGTSHAEITAVVRGGLVLDVYIRQNDRTAQISFLNSSDAKAFYDHVRRHDLYIKHKRVDIRWSERQFVLPGHVAGKIGIGATRNLVIRRCDAKMTEENIRDDLEHIHNLVVIRVTFAKGNCHISTNSVNNAMFARTCMMSRLKYKGSKIEWDTDECTQPIQVTAPKARVQPVAPPKRLNPMANRFQLLGLDGCSDDDTDDELSSTQNGLSSED